jgi:hypothetical protein
MRSRRNCDTVLLFAACKCILVSAVLPHANVSLNARDSRHCDAAPWEATSQEVPALLFCYDFL